jgi:hypothetical protein
MSEINSLIPNKNEQEQFRLKAKIEILQQELNDVQQKTDDFEAILRSYLADIIIEEQELTVLYKKIQKAKKEKRLTQKKKGKNYKESEGVKVVSKKINVRISTDDQKEKKRLYREAMLNAHPDKYSLNEEKIDLATEVTTKLIEIYQNGTFQELQTYHTHILSGNALMNYGEESFSSKHKTIDDSYLKQELEKLEKLLAATKKKQTYKVLTEYKKPLTFIDELLEYYKDRIFKLKKRTRKADKFDL